MNSFQYTPSPSLDGHGNFAHSLPFIINEGELICYKLVISRLHLSTLPVLSGSDLLRKGIIPVMGVYTMHKFPEKQEMEND